MKPITSLTVLTLVLFSLGTPRLGLAQEEEEDTPCSNSQLTELKKAESAAKLNYDNVSYKANDEAGKRALTPIQSILTAAQNAVASCQEARKQKRDTKKESCTDLDKKRKEITDKFDESAQIVAAECLNSDSEEEGQFTRAAIMALGGYPNSTPPRCDLGGLKTNNKEKRETLEKDVEKLETAARKTDETLLKKEKNLQDELEKIEEDRKKAKDDYQAAMEGAEDAQVKAMSALRDKQSQLAENIRKLNAAAITARQNVGSIEIEMKQALTNAKAPNGKVVNLRSESAINLHCMNLMKQTNKENYGTGSSKNASSGSSRAATLKDAYINCTNELHDLRNTLGVSFSNALEQRLQTQKEVNEQIESANTQYAQLTKDYNDMLARLQKRLTDAQTKFFELDNKLANKANQAMQNSQKETARLTSEKNMDNQKIAGKVGSQGKLLDSDIEQIDQSGKRLEEVETEMMDKKCPNAPKMTTLKRIGERMEKRKEEKENAVQ